MKNTLRRVSFASLVVASFVLCLSFIPSPAVPEAGATGAEEVKAIPPPATAPLEILPATAPEKKPAREPEKITVVHDGLVPASVAIPGISLETRVIPVGVNQKGEMDVPSGKTSDVGWYRHGVKAGAVGSAVLDAHVYAAFKNLHKVRPGDSIYVKDAEGRKLRFIVEETQLKTVEETSTWLLFARKDKARLNLITCAGTYIPSRGTYDKRFVVYAVLADEV